MDEGRRGFLKATGASLLGLGLGLPAVATRVKGSGGEAAAGAAEGPRWAMVVDTRKCQEKNGCRACIDACHTVHNVPRMVV